MYVQREEETLPTTQQYQHSRIQNLLSEKLNKKQK